MNNRKHNVTLDNQLTEQWSSKWGFILAATGAAVGLGNIWRFPYMAGINGGSAFVLVYLICLVLIGVPIMIAEILLGRLARQNPIDAFANLAQQSGRSRLWCIVPWVGAVALLLVLSFYSVVSGWAIAYIIRCFSGQFAHANATQVQQLWQNFLANPWQLLLWHSVFMLLTMGVIVRGVQNGLEKATRWMMPALYALLIILAVYACNVGSLRATWHFLMDFNVHKITIAVVIAAMGHAFFTLAVGAGAMLTYGAYMPKRVSIVQTVGIVSVLDVIVALLSGFAIFPIVFAFHLPPQSGPGLMFVTLPISFSHMQAGSLIGGLFFMCLLFAAWTSSINLAEPLVALIRQRLRVSRLPAAVIIGLLAWVFGLGSLLSFNVWQHITIFGGTVFSWATNLPTNFLLPIGGLGIAIFTGWVISHKTAWEELATHSWLYYTWRFLLRYVAPIAIVIIFISALR